MLDGYVARAGEKVTTPQGKVICIVKHDIPLGARLSAEYFHKFAKDEIPWTASSRIDDRCFRSMGMLGGVRICINGEWRPSIQ